MRRLDDSFSAFLGMRIEEDGTTRLTVRPELINPVGLLLGPVTFALVDYGMTATLLAAVEPDERIATTGMAITYVAGAREGEVICTTALDRRGRRVGSLSSRVHHEDGRVLATAVGSFAVGW